MVKTINIYKRLVWIGAIISALAFSLTGELFYLVFVVINILELIFVPRWIERFKK
ncbi:hypothetical protein FHS19_000102 [Paenibacillus rhizosphaerae]|uniref:Uncharacterized protein n=1 Tax=Paenibacillus rhizosphaerae TaxID=297318 RepID=A0A839TJ77_9BACL|nr:hypothetical protein [Paenibacillus rhizosphaerae]